MISGIPNLVWRFLQELEGIVMTHILKRLVVLFIKDYVQRFTERNL